ncbi:PREDICTED: anthranilate synthase component I-1, chloroplastic-like isoform 1 [Fragaria vesca subsp. vesca]
MSRISPGAVSLQTHQFGPSLTNSNMTSEAIVKEAKDHILSGDIFQVVLSQRFERRTYADPFETYRSLRTVNPSPYLTYLQVASSQEILMSAKKII